jgi:hypothetical protein
MRGAIGSILGKFSAGKGSAISVKIPKPEPNPSIEARATAKRARKAQRAIREAFLSGRPRTR